MDRRRQNPLRGFVDMTSEMNRMRHLGLYGQDPSPESLHRTHASAWVPTADVFARGPDLVIRFELPGVRRDGVEITFEAGELEVSGNRPCDAEEDDFYVRERSYGFFRRSMTLPGGVDDDDISADFTDGLLEITVADGAFVTEPKRINIT